MDNFEHQTVSPISPTNMAKDNVLKIQRALKRSYEMLINTLKFFKHGYKSNYAN